MNVKLALAVLALFNSVAITLAVGLGLTWLIHVLFPGIAHPWHPYVPWGFIVSLPVYLLLPGAVRTQRGGAVTAPTPRPSWHDLPALIRALNKAGEAALARRLAHCWRRLERLLADEAEDAPEYDPTLTRFATLKFEAFERLGGQ